LNWDKELKMFVIFKNKIKYNDHTVEIFIF